MINKILLPATVLSCSSIFILLIAALNANARGSSSRQMVPVGMGISSPAANTMLPGSENPAGVPHLGAAQIVVTAAQPEDSSYTSAGAALNWGNGSFGVDVGISVNKPANSTTTSQSTLWALGGHIDTLNTSLGVSGTNNTSGSSSEMGLLINPMGMHRFGISSSGSNALGFGYSYVGNSVTLTLDATTTSNGNGNSNSSVIAPGIIFNANTFQFALTQKINGGTNSNSSTTMAALGFGTENFAMSLYYNYLATYGLGLTFGF